MGEPNLGKAQIGERHRGTHDREQETQAKTKLGDGAATLFSEDRRATASDETKTTLIHWYLEDLQ